ncbi:uncharacterized protein MELLADRAFT_68194 [Melampsora larici-populina 98AG31]|uniref:Uncharacterized protein n=1 Tax=Melampsora larici-populina (strain 98AG31 / pathotype 3-4-7) TaxID=747676 RepID=F4S5X5_MELLP|nr:uncharacterized protein MELLADRAFT_68194 [Melampsora larici-populina 98AG31]EGF99978.1 hypothetical protein MELLADRAFT_68194 [Melampsora larici-populina 98AG31]
MNPEDVDSSAEDATVTEGSSSSDTSDSFGTVKDSLLDPISSSSPRQDPSTRLNSTSHALTMSESVEHRTFGTPIQKFSQSMTNAMSKYKVSADLSDDNHTEWSQSIMEVLRSLNLHQFVKVKDYTDEELTPEENEITRFNVTTYILHRLDTVNSVRTRNRLTDPNDASEIIYDPFLCWNFLKEYHNRISEDKLESVTRTLYACRISSSDSLTVFVDKFENLIREFYRLKGEMSDAQSARMLLGAIPSLKISG